MSYIKKPLNPFHPPLFEVVELQIPTDLYKLQTYIRPLL